MDITEDQTSPDQLRDAFRGIAKDKVKKSLNFYFFAKSQIVPQPYVTELDLRLAHLPPAAIDYLREAMPNGRNEAGEAEYDYEKFIDEVFT